MWFKWFNNIDNILKFNNLILNQLVLTSTGLNQYIEKTVYNCISICCMWFKLYLSGLNQLNHIHDLCGLICPPIGGLLTLNHMVKPYHTEGGTTCR